MFAHLFRRYVNRLLLILFVWVAGCSPTAAPAPEPELPLRNDAVSEVREVAATEMPLDATPDPDGQWVYFTARGEAGPGLFKVSAEGGEVTTVAQGAPLVGPLGLAISTDGQRLYVADPEADALFTVPTEGGAPTVLAGSEGSAPRVPEIVREGESDQLYFSGQHDGQPAVLKLAAEGGSAPTVIAQGAPLVEPGGVAVARDGTVYAVDRAAGGDGQGALFRIRDGSVEELARGFRAGQPVAGLTLAPDDSLLLVSTLHPTRDSAQVLLVNPATGEQAIMNKGIAQNEGAGGVHRAHDAAAYAWAGSTIRGQVYSLR